MKTFRDHAPAYARAGFIPVPWMTFDKVKKTPLAAGYLEENPPVHDWMGRWPRAEVGIVSHGWIGIDIDAAEHAGKAGDDTIRSLEQTLGKLPEGISSTARGKDSKSRIRFFRIPVDGKRYRDVGRDVESIRPGHRYAAVYPSRHPSGGIYTWYDGDGEEMDHIPSIYDFPHLPDSWREYLVTAHQQQAYYSGSIPVWKSALKEGEMPDEIRERLLETEEEFGHNDLLRILSWLASEGANGVPGILEAFDVVRDNFLRGDWNDSAHRTEYEKALEWAIRNAGTVKEETPEETFADVLSKWQDLTNPTLEFEKRDLELALKSYCQSLTTKFSNEAVLLFRECKTWLEDVHTDKEADLWMEKSKAAMKKVISG